MIRFSLLFTLLISMVLSTLQAKTTISVASINIRYDSHKDGVNDWDCRKDDFTKYFNKENNDIICMQEVLHSQLQDIITRMPIYSYVGIGRTDGKTRGEYVPIFYKKDRFKVIDYGTFWLSNTPYVIGSKGWDADQQRIATWVKLKENKSAKEFFVINTHFDNIGKIAKIKSSELIIEWIKENTGNIPVIVAGDFNDTPSSDTYKKITDGGYLLDTNNLVKNKGVNYSFHAFGSLEMNRRVKVDYIFVSINIDVKNVKIVTEKLKNGHYLSDHNPVFVKLKI